MAVVITHARTTRVPSSVSADGVSVWMRIGSPASVSISNQVKEFGRAGITVGNLANSCHCITKKHPVLQRYLV